MKKGLLIVGSAAILLVALNGCSSVNWESIGYLSPANEVSLKEKPSIKFIAVGDKAMLTPLVEKLKGEFVKSGQFEFDATTPDYWIILSGKKNFRADDAKTLPFNREIKKVAKETSTGGKEFILRKDAQSSTAAAMLSIAVYGVKNLNPVYYFDIALYDADFKGGAVRQRTEYDSAFENQLIAKIKDAFLVQKRNIDTALPKNADKNMQSALLAGDTQGVANRAKQILPADFDSFMKDVLAGKYKEKKDEQESMLSNYYILALSQEIGNFEPENLEKLHARHLAILKQTTEDGLSIACPNSLARIESKLKLLQSLK